MLPQIFWLSFPILVQCSSLLFRSTGWPQT